MSQVYPALVTSFNPSAPPTARAERGEELNKCNCVRLKGPWCGSRCPARPPKHGNQEALSRKKQLYIYYIIIYCIVLYYFLLYYIILYYIILYCIIRYLIYIQCIYIYIGERSKKGGRSKQSPQCDQVWDPNGNGAYFPLPVEAGMNVEVLKG